MSDRWIRADWQAPDNVIAGTTLRSGDIAVIQPRGLKCWLNQVHGATVVEARTYETAPEADASISRDPEVVCVVRTADCLPVLFAARDGSEVAAAHAGWRGLAAGILENTVAAMRTAPADLLAWFGPAISQPNFEVGDEVREAFTASDAGAAACFVPNERGRWQADLYALARRRLQSAGIDRVSGGGLCTFADPERYFSYRRNAETGRLVSFVALK
jgi:YfiH family protein